MGELAFFRVLRWPCCKHCPCPAAQIQWGLDWIRSTYAPRHQEPCFSCDLENGVPVTILARLWRRQRNGTPEHG